MFIALFTIAKTWKRSKCPLTDAWIKKMWYIHAVECYSVIKMKECHLQQHEWTWRLSYWVKSERERQISYDITYMWNLKYDTNEHMYETETDSQTKRTDLSLPRSQSETIQRQIPYDYHLYVESKIWQKWTYLRSRNRLTDTENRLWRLVVAKVGGVGWGRVGLRVWD